MLLKVGNTSAQMIPTEFTYLSGGTIHHANIDKLGDKFVLNITYKREGSESLGRNKIYQIFQNGLVSDSIDLHNGGTWHNGVHRAIDSRLYYFGVTSKTGQDYTERYSVFELNSQLNKIRSFESAAFSTLRGLVTNTQNSYGYVDRAYDFTMLNDTIYSIGKYFLVDSPLVILGVKTIFFKASMKGKTYLDKAINAEIKNCFFHKNKFYIQGIVANPDNPGLAYPMAQFNHEGNLVKGYTFDKEPLGFPYAGCGGAIDDLLYLSYVSEDATQKGCKQNNVCIDIRDTNFVCLYKFKIDECDYLYSGRLPFAKGKDGSIYFQAVHKDYKSMILKKYSPDMQPIWSKVYDFPDDSLYTIPIEILPTDDGGVLMHHQQRVNATTLIRLYKVSPDGDIVSSTVFGGANKPKKETVLSPNPCTDRVTYTGAHGGALTALVYDMNGVSHGEMTSVSGAFDTSKLPSGVYQVALFDPTDHKTVLHTQTLVKVE
jgi:hypothetical protein